MSEAWIEQRFAQDWTRDAYLCANRPDDVSRRHEIIFSVCLVESYLFEWVRDYPFKDGKRAKLDRYFPGKKQRGIETRFDEVTENLHGDGLIAGCVDRGVKIWFDFTKVIELRNALSHASISRPAIMAYRKKSKHKQSPPPPLALIAVKQGHAFRVVQRLLLEMHRAAAAPAPAWLEKPETYWDPVDGAVVYVNTPALTFSNQCRSDSTQAAPARRRERRSVRT